MCPQPSTTLENAFDAILALMRLKFLSVGSAHTIHAFDERACGAEQAVRTHGRSTKFIVAGMRLLLRVGHGFR